MLYTDPYNSLKWFYAMSAHLWMARKLATVYLCFDDSHVNGCNFACLLTYDPFDWAGMIEDISDVKVTLSLLAVLLGMKVWNGLTAFWMCILHRATCWGPKWDFT